MSDQCIGRRELVTTEEHAAAAAQIVEELAQRPEGDARPHHIREAEAQKGIDPLYALEVFLARLPIVRDVARAHGYAIGVHGSMKRDLDLIAAPWTEAASPPASLAKAIEVAVDGFVVKGPEGRDRFPYTKPHGRLCWSIHLGGGPFIDLSVFPPMKESA